ncbi:MAG: hypothetical protein HYZ28_14535 [Myxococcales bacterium]|nr:hypothetical protein [Myxococcales bacterium]
MSDADKGLGSKILGLFVETEDQPAPALEQEKSPADVVAELARESSAAGAPTPPPVALRLEAAKAPPAPADFDAIFHDAGMEKDELDRVRKAEELLRGLPEATSVAVKRQIVEAALKAFGFEIEKIIQAAQNQKRALDAYVRVNENATAKAIAEAQAQIQALNEKIATARAEIDKRTSGLSNLAAAAQARKEQVQKVLDFFHVPAGPAPQP